MLFFKNLINIGVKTEMEFYKKREARMINLFSVINLFGLLIGVTTVFFISGDYAINTVIFSTSTSLTILFLNYKSYHSIATYIFVITLTLVIFLINEQYVDAVGNYLYYFPVIFCVALIHNPTKPNTRTVIFFLIVTISFLCSRIFEINSLRIQSITQNDNEALLLYNSFLAFIVTVILVYLVVKLINIQNNEALGLLEKEREAQIIISQSLKEKETLLAEIQHRVKNNLAIITGLLNFQLEKAPCEESKQLMLESKNRVMSIAMVHNSLYKKDNLSKIDLRLYLSELVQELVNSLNINEHKVLVKEELEFIEMELTRAVPIGLIINEALTNSLKHAFTRDNNTPIVQIKIQRIYDKIQICLSDNGIGFQNLEHRNDLNLGLSIIESLCDQIDANVVFRNDNGASVSFTFQY